MSDKTTSIDLIEDANLDTATGGGFGLLLPAVHTAPASGTPALGNGLLLPAVQTQNNLKQIGIG